MKYLAVFALLTVSLAAEENHVAEAVKETSLAALEAALGAAHVIDCPMMALGHAVLAGEHLSHALDHIKAYTEQQERQNQLNTQAQWDALADFGTDCPHAASSTYEPREH